MVRIFEEGDGELMLSCMSSHVGEGVLDVGIDGNKVDSVGSFEELLFAIAVGCSADSIPENRQYTKF